ncbi:MAG: 2-oxoacid:ferredoxin oxidoreductase subunit beta [Desulfobacteraceae bacterium]|jgi:2-oxoglutarate ferredoxin oxidoreductase subunit beta
MSRKGGRKEDKHPKDELLREDRIPHIFCPGCGIGSALSAGIHALQKMGIDYDQFAVVSGIGCTGRVAGYLNLDSFHTTHGRAIPFATGLKLAKPELNVFVFSGEGDLFAIGGNHFIHAARRNIDITVICVNNMNYGMTGGQVSANTPVGARTTTTPYGNVESPLNLPSLAAACGAVYVARWLSLDVRRLAQSIQEALLKPGFTFVEIIAPCPVAYGRRNRLGTALDMIKLYQANCVIKNGAHPDETVIEEGKKMLLGKFIDIERPTLLERLSKMSELKGAMWPQKEMTT